ncbi:uncharacterized protein [Delphinus delphis]|uniref:uncharacterized protein isoform X3 n=1 Tax=Delphinus delphis TaxID=9728 RepID=UPI0037513341
MHHLKVESTFYSVDKTEDLSPGHSTSDNSGTVPKSLLTAGTQVAKTWTKRTSWVAQSRNGERTESQRAALINVCPIGSHSSCFLVSLWPLPTESGPRLPQGGSRHSEEQRNQLTFRMNFLKLSAEMDVCAHPFSLGICSRDSGLPWPWDPPIHLPCPVSAQPCRPPLSTALGLLSLLFSSSPSCALSQTRDAHKDVHFCSLWLPRRRHGPHFLRSVCSWPRGAGGDTGANRGHADRDTPWEWRCEASRRPAPRWGRAAVMCERLRAAQRNGSQRTHTFGRGGRSQTQGGHILYDPKFMKFRKRITCESQ